MLTFLLAILVALIVFNLLFKPQRGVLFLFMFFPIIAMAWRTRFVAGLGFLDVICVAAPLMILPVVFGKSEKSNDFKLWKKLSVIYFLTCTIGVFMPMGDASAMNRADTVLRAMSGLLGFLMLPRLFRDPKRFKQLLVVIMLSGIPPMLISFYQMKTGVVWRQGLTVGLNRFQGLYHDASTLRHVGHACLIAAFLFYYCYRPKKRVELIAFCGYVAAWMPVMYKVYSKAGTLILVLWALIWCITQKKIAMAISLVFLFIAVNVAMKSTVVEETQTLFSKEVDVAKGQSRDDRLILGGRGFIWQSAYHYWIDLNVLNQVFGSGKVKAVHNEFLRILICNGIVGVLVYIYLMGYIGVHLSKIYLRQPSPINTAALMAFSWWLIDCTGLHPGLYPYMQWFVWGIIGCAFTGAPEMANNKGPQLLLRRIRKPFVIRPEDSEPQPGIGSLA